MSHTASRWRLAVAAWFLGLPGPLAASLLWLPQILQGRDLPAPAEAIIAASIAQSALLLAVAAGAGAALAHRVGLRGPVLEALVFRRPLPALQPILVSGVVGGAIGAALLLAIGGLTPAPLQDLQDRFSMPIAVRLLYGGVTEEVLVRWGLMSAALWMLWRFVQRGKGAASPALVAAAIVVSALAFAAGHLPAAGAMLGVLDGPAIAYVMLANSLFGLLAGWLYWKRGLESAMLAHALAHLLMLAA